MAQKEYEVHDINNFQFTNSEYFYFFFRFGRKNVWGRCRKSDPWSRRLSRKYQLRTIRQDGFGQQLILNSLIHEFWIFYEYSPPARERKTNHSFKFMTVFWLKNGFPLAGGNSFFQVGNWQKTKHVPYYLTIYINCDDCIKLKKNTNINNYLYLNSMVIFIEVLHICGSFWLLAMSRDIFQAESWDVYG